MVSYGIFLIYLDKFTERKKRGVVENLSKETPNRIVKGNPDVLNDGCKLSDFVNCLCYFLS